MGLLTEEISQSDLSVVLGTPALSIEDKVFGTAVNMVDGALVQHSSPAKLTTTDFTVAWWMKRSSWSGLGTTYPIFRYSLNEESTQGWAITIYIDHLEVFCGTSGLFQSTDLPLSALSAAEWNHLAWVKQGTTTWFFINGAVRATRSWSTAFSTTTRSLFINYHNQSGRYTHISNLLMDDIIITDTALWTSAFNVSTVTPAVATAGTTFLAPFDVPQYRISGVTNEDSRVLVFNESTWALENSEDVSEGSYILSVSAGAKTIIAVPVDDTNNIIGYRKVTPILQQ